MHRYLKAIGFGNINSKKQLNDILNQAEETFTRHQLVTQSGDMDYCEFDKEYGAGIGIRIFGDTDNSILFQNVRLYPYLRIS